MSTDPIGAAFERDDAAVAASAPQLAAEPSCELSGIAMAIERVEALLASCGPGPQSSDAIERIADIAFVLHERDVEASLCDALDVAVRELSSANAVRQTNVQHVRQAAELLRDLSRRIADMIAPLQVSPPPAPNDLAASEGAPSEPEAAPAEEPASEDLLDGEIQREGLFGAEVLEDDEFARAVAELAASLPALAEPVEAVVVTLREPADLAADELAVAAQSAEAITEAKQAPADLMADQPALAPEPEGPVTETKLEPADLAADDSVLVLELEESSPETQHKPADLAADEPALVLELEESSPETQDEAAALAADEPALAAEQKLPAIDDAPEAIEQIPTEESQIAEVVNAQLARADAVPAPDAPPEERKDTAISSAMLLSEGALRETLSDEALSESADAATALPADLPGDSPNHSLVSVHGAADSPPDVDAARVPPEMPSIRRPDEAAEHETALPDGSGVAAPGAEPETPTPGEPPPPQVDSAAIAGEPPSDQMIVRPNGGDGPSQIGGKANGHDAADAAAEPAINVGEPPPPQFTESSQSLLPELALVDPQDDPGDLFEPLAGAAAPIVETNLASEVSAPSAEMQAYPAAVPPDPLAAMRTLSAEELLALFT